MVECKFLTMCNCNNFPCKFFWNSCLQAHLNLQNWIKMKLNHCKEKIKLWHNYNCCLSNVRISSNTKHSCKVEHLFTKNTDKKYVEDYKKNFNVNIIFNKNSRYTTFHVSSFRNHSNIIPIMPPSCALLTCTWNDNIRGKD